MPPKKVEEPEKKPLIGRVGTNLKVGIVGVPNVGKSTFFNVLTKSQAAAENFPFCTIDPNERNIILNNMKKYDVDVVDKHHLKDVWVHDGVVFSGDIKRITKTQVEDTIPSLLGAAAVLGLNNTAAPSASSSKDLWTDIDVQETYLNTKPTCYLILGKPGVGAYSLGEALSKKYNCVHLCPKNIILDEIMQGSVTGKCLDFNMKHNNICSHKTILKMLKRKIESPAVQHRGYVISGIPIVTACKETAYLIKSNHGENSLDIVEDLLYDLICNLNKKKRMPHKTTDSSRTSFSDDNFKQEAEEEEVKQEEEELEEAEEEIVAKLPKYILNTCRSICFNIEAYFETKQTIYLQQLEGLFNLTLKPDIILFITCPDADVVTKKLHQHINYKNDHYTFEPFSKIDASDLRWPSLYNIQEIENPHDIHVFNHKYNCRAPINFRKKSVDQLCNYKSCVLPFIEKTLKDFDPKQVIKLDARTSTYLMMHQVTERLLLMQVNPVIIPEPFSIEEPPDDFEEFWTKVEESNVISSGVLKFERCASPWLNRCPVELKKRQSVVGKPKLAVMFFKHVYLMYSLNNFVSFCRNPRPFLKLQYLEPTCRIIITGTKSSGKTMTAECLSWLFDTPISSFEFFVEKRKEMKYQMYAKTILSEIIATIEDARFNVWQQIELDRVAHLNEWNNSMLSILTKYVPLLKIIREYEEYKATRLKLMELKAKNVEETMGEDEDNIIEEESLTEEQDPEVIAEFNSIRQELSSLPILDNLEDCETAIINNSLLIYAPNELITVTEKPLLPVLGDEDVTKAISEYIEVNDLQKYIEPTIEETMEEIINFISHIDTNKQGTNSNECYGKYIIDGFPSDAEYWEHLSDAKVMPDYTIAIIENRDIEPDLMLHYLNIVNCVKNHQEVFSAITDPLILSKLQTKKFANTNMLNMKMIANDLINDCVNTLNDGPENVRSDEPSAELIGTFTEAIERFRENWDSIKIKLEDVSKCYIEVELENKSDIEVLEEVLLKLRQCYCLKPELNEDEVVLEEEDDSAKHLLSYNSPQNFGETGIYCPITYFKHGVLWEGKQEFSLIYDSKLHYFAKEEFLELFRRDITEHQAYNRPFKQIPNLKICITGSLGSGATTLSKYIATELGLIHIDFKDYLNNFYLPRHFKKVGRKYENPFTDVSLEEEEIVEYQMDEENPNLLSDILSNEAELRHMVYNYYERGQPIIPVVMHNILKKIWFKYPFNKTGFVLDGYPRLPQDIEDLVLCNCIPDLVITIDTSPETAVERLGPTMFNQWKSQFKQAKEVYRLKIQSDHREWLRFITKKVVVKLIMEEILDNVIEEEILPKNNDLSYDSFIFDAHPQGAVQVDPKLFIAYNEMIEEYPEVKDSQEWDKPEDIREGIDARLEVIHESDYENIETLKEVALDNKIKLITVDGIKPFYKVCRQTLVGLSSLRERTQSFFERTLIIPTDIAEMLLSQGFYFLSKFGRLCPVYIHENPQTIFNSYKISRRKGKLYPIIHRAYIFFISSQENVNKFRTDPLKYVTSKAIQTYCTYPLCIGIIGAPKTGKSSLAAALAKQKNLLCISRGIALRYVLENMHWTELASDILKDIRSRNVISSDLILNAIQSVAFDHRATTYGFVLDGFPSTPYEAMALSKIGLYPNIIFDISSERRAILHNSQNEVYNDILKYKPPYAYSFIENRFTAWNEQSNRIRQWIKNDYQNICVLNGNESKWQCLQDANIKIDDLITKIHYYLANVGNKIVPAYAMTISNEIFEEKQSGYRNMCPACIRTNVLRHSGYINDRTGIVQYKDKLYWTCADHLDRVLMYPEYYLSVEVSIPELPAIVKVINTNNVYENGICIVTYAENLPAQILERGTNKFAATYKLKTYLFCSDACLHKFLDKPHLYCDITVFKESSSFPKLSLNKLPNLGYLEQTLANILTEACCAVNVLRPKYPGLSFQVSALIYIGLFLQSHNSRLPKHKSELYDKALKRFEKRSKLILDLGLRMRSMENPFLTYPDHGDGNLQKCSSSFKYSKQVISPAARRVPVPDERFDYLCEFHKPASKVPAFLNVVDIAGLVRGAAEGQGLGNAFLSHIKACDAIFNLCRAFDDEDVIHVDGDVNPVRDLETIGEELRLKDEEQLMQNIEKLDRVVNRGNDKKLKPEYDTLMKIKTVLVDEKKHIRFGDWSAADIEVLNKYLFLTSKPALYLVNLSEKDYIRKKNKWLPKLKEWIDKNDPGAPLIPFSGALEIKLVEMDAAERQAFLKENNLTSALDKIIVQGYKALQLEYFFTAGPDEVKAWTIQKGTKAPQAAGRIHTDFEKGFIMAEVMHYKDFKEEGTEAACKAAGKYRQQGRNYVVEDGDIIFFKFNAGAGLKDAKKK